MVAGFVRRFYYSLTSVCACACSQTCTRHPSSPNSPAPASHHNIAIAPLASFIAPREHTVPALLMDVACLSIVGCSSRPSAKVQKDYKGFIIP